MLVDSDQTCLICATISSAIFRKCLKSQLLRLKLHNIVTCANTVKKSCRLCSIHFLYSLCSAKNIEIAVDILCDFPNSKRGHFKRKMTLK